MKLYFSPGACSLSPHIVLEESGLSYQLEKVDLRTKETQSGDDFYMISTKGAVPALELDSGDVLTEGAVIVQYIADQVPEKDLIPLANTIERYRAMEWLNFIATDLQKSFTAIFNPGFAASKDAAKKVLLKQFDYVDRQLANRQFAMGDRFSVVDAYLFTITSWLQYAELSLGQWKALSGYMERIAQRDSVKKAMADEGLTGK